MKSTIVNKVVSIFLCREQMDDIESKRPESPIGTRYSISDFLFENMQASAGLSLGDITHSTCYF